MSTPKHPTPESNLEEIYSVNDSVQAELIKNMLADHGIDAQLGGEHQGGFTGTLDVKIIVRESDAQAAMEFIQIHFPNA